MSKVPKPKIIWKGAHPSNYTIGRPGGKRSGLLVPHHIVGSANSAVAVFQNPSRNASAHFVVGENVIYQMVSINDTAWTNGNWKSNLESITIEHEGGWRYENGKYGPYTVAMQETAAELLAWLIDQDLVDRYTYHRTVTNGATVCPGDLPYPKIWARAEEIIKEYYNPTPPPLPEWLANREVLPKDESKDFKVYSHKAGIFLYDLDGKLQPIDTRRWGVNQDFQIGGTTKVGGKTFYITRSSVNSNAAAGLLESEISRTPYVPPQPEPTPPPQPDTPEWVDSIIDEPNTEQYVLRATPLIDLENGRPFINPVTQKETWFQAGDIVKDVSAHTIVDGKKYVLTEYAFVKVGQGEWKKFGNGILADDLSVDPISAPPETPANPDKPEPSNPLDKFIKIIVDLIMGVIEAMFKRSK